MKIVGISKQIEFHLCGQKNIYADKKNKETKGTSVSRIIKANKWFNSHLGYGNWSLT